MLIHVATVAFGGELWASKVDHLVPALAAIPYADAPLRAWIVLLGVGLMGGIGMLQSIVRVVRSVERAKRARLLLELAPVVILTVASVLAWTGARAAGGHDGAEQAIAFASSALGMRLIGRVVLEAIADLPARLFDPAHAPIVVTAALFWAARAGILTQPLPVDAIAWVVLAVTAVASATELVGTTIAIARRLGLPLLTLPRSQR
jgi:hypothetical protein